MVKQLGNPEKPWKCFLLYMTWHLA